MSTSLDQNLCPTKLIICSIIEHFLDHITQALLYCTTFVPMFLKPDQTGRFDWLNWESVAYSVRLKGYLKDGQNLVKSGRTGQTSQTGQSLFFWKKFCHWESLWNPKWPSSFYSLVPVTSPIPPTQLPPKGSHSTPSRDPARFFRITLIPHHFCSVP